MVPVNVWAVIASAIVGFALGGLWYGPIFGKQWMKLQGISMGGGDGKNGMAWRYIIMGIGTLLMSYTFAHALIFGDVYLNMSGVGAGLQGAFWYWLGFIAPVTVGVVLWEGKPWKLWFINAGYYLVSLLLMGIILSLWI